MKNKKVKFFEPKILKEFGNIIGIISTIISLILIFVDIPNDKKIILGIMFIVFLVIIYVGIWIKNNYFLKRIELNINNCNFEIKEGDIFEQDGLKVIGFNEFFDTELGDRLISETTLHGIYLKKYIHNQSDKNILDNKILNDSHLSQNIIETNVQRFLGKTTRYKLGTIYKNDDFLLTAFSKFDDDNRAYLTKDYYIDFLLNFWQELDMIYSGKNIAIPLLGSGITRFNNGRKLTNQELLESLIFTFKLSNINFTSRISIIIYKDTFDTINLFKLKGDNYEL